jgi:hypothetical protein
MGLYYHNGTAWINLGTGGTTPTDPEGLVPTTSLTPSTTLTPSGA